MKTNSSTRQNVERTVKVMPERKEAWCLRGRAWTISVIMVSWKGVWPVGCGECSCNIGQFWTVSVGGSLIERQSWCGAG